jgi:hypothetical protein
MAVKGLAKPEFLLKDRVREDDLCLIWIKGSGQSFDPGAACLEVPVARSMGGRASL